MTAQYEGYDTYSKSVLFIWKYQVSLGLVFQLKNQENFVFLCGSLRG